PGVIRTTGPRSAVQPGRPVRRAPLRRARGGLRRGVAAGRGEGRAGLVQRGGGVVVEPVLARFVAVHQRVAGGPVVRRRVLPGRAVAAADVAARGAPPQVEPPAAGRVAVDAAGTARRDDGADGVAGHGCSSGVSGESAADGAVSGSSTWTRVSPGTDSNR